MSAAQKVQQHPMYIQAQGQASYYVNQLDKELTKYPVLNSLEQRTQIPKTYTVIGGAALLVLLHLINPSPPIESPSPQDDIQWLTYWVVFGFFNFLESFALRAVLYYLPWYFAFKTIFILWLQLPAFRVSVPFSFFPLRSVATHTYPCFSRVFSFDDRSLTMPRIQGAQTTYLTLLKPVLANVSGRQVAPSTSATVDASLHHD
ncbi:hypothetical protein B0H13DRAFT_2129980 [Mycena leptocephala]|nr:hypothetical protein B0H13DRAFT_2129980 [Mycena leptocephala]